MELDEFGEAFYKYVDSPDSNAMKERNRKVGTHSIM